jgi:hypothetical protein
MPSYHEQKKQARDKTQAQSRRYDEEAELEAAAAVAGIVTPTAAAAAEAAEAEHVAKSFDQAAKAKLDAKISGVGNPAPAPTPKTTPAPAAVPDLHALASNTAAAIVGAIQAIRTLDRHDPGSESQLCRDLLERVHRIVRARWVTPHAPPARDP